MVAPTENKSESCFFTTTYLFSVMLSLSKHLAEALLEKQKDLTLAEENLNTRTTLPRGIRKNSFPRDSSTTLGMTWTVKTYA